MSSIGISSSDVLDCISSTPDISVTPVISLETKRDIFMLCTSLKHDILYNNVIITLMIGILINQQTYTYIVYLDVKRWQTLYFSTLKIIL